VTLIRYFNAQTCFGDKTFTFYKASPKSFTPVSEKTSDNMKLYIIESYGNSTAS